MDEGGRRGPSRRALRGMVPMVATAMLRASGCFVEVSAGAYKVNYGEATARTSTGVGIAFGAYLDMGANRVALGIGGDVTEVEGYEDASGTGSVGHGVGPFFARGDMALTRLSRSWSLDATAAVLGGKGPAVVIYDQPLLCAAGCAENVEQKDGNVKVSHAGPSVGGFFGTSIALHNRGPGELRLSLGVSVLHTRVAPRSPMTAVGPQVRLVYGFTRFGSKDANFSGLFKGYSNSLDQDLKDFDKTQSDRNQRRRDEEKRQRDENERKRKGY